MRNENYYFPKKKKNTRKNSLLYRYFNFLFFNLTEGLVSYVAPKGAQRGTDVDLNDKTYDGEDKDDRLVGGLGLLSDGQKGHDNFRFDAYGTGRGE